MRSISLKIVLAIVLCSAAGLIINGVINLAVSSQVVRENIIEELHEIAKVEELEFQRELDDMDRAVAILEGALGSSFDIEQLGDDEYVEGYKRQARDQIAGIAGQLEVLNSYIYFNPEFYKGGQLSVVDLNRDGEFQDEDEIVLADIDEVRMNSAEYAWYTEAVKNGEYWSAPYYWEPYKMSLISHTKAVYVDDRLLAIVGSDLAVDEAIEHFNTTVILKDGNMFLMDSELNILIEEDFAGHSLKDLSPVNYEKFMAKLQAVDSDKTVDYNFRNEKRVLVYEIMDNGWILCITVSESAIWSELNRMRVIFVIFLLLVIAVSAVIAYFISRSIANPIKSITMSMDRIATGDGDLTQKLDISSRDEVGLLADRFNAFIDKLKMIVEGARKSAGNDEAIVKELQRVVADSSSAINQISANIYSVKGQIDNLDSNIMDSTTSIEEVSTNINSIKNQVENQGAAVEQSTAAIEQMISSLNSVVQVTRRKLDSVEQLVKTVRQGGEQLKATNETFDTGVAKRIGEITEMVKVINSISAQTNLLAMNASIEAAHAGESGRGFAVVAEEIRSMAETSAESAGNIGRIINQIVEAIKQTSDSVESTSQAFVAIDKEVLDFKGAFQEIATSTSEISTGGNEVLRAVTELNQITSLILTGIKEINTAASQVRGAMLDVKQNSSQGLKGINEISKGAGYVEESVYRVSQQAEELASETEVLLDELNKFKT